MFDWLVSAYWRWRNGETAEEWHSSYPAIPDGMECPDTQPTSPGALDSDLARLE